MTTRDTRRAPGFLEAEVMSLLWRLSAGQPLTAGELQSLLGGDLAYNTVHTVLTRLRDKGVVQRRKAGRGHVYWPVTDAATAAAAQMSAALSGHRDRTAVLQQFAESLDEHDAASLRQFLEGRP